MELVKIKDKTNGAVIEVKKSLASDYIGTGKYIAVIPEKEIKKASVEEEPIKTERKIGFGKNSKY